ncbi:CMF_collapsed_G0013300.mRNA.1.CDS.1 [Saccharomyces cerevisiae]|nr:CMF_collapsed_G0013300.mRNA.1.CDS.1 [Saccharomyces cerevisiae]
MRPELLLYGSQNRRAKKFHLFPYNVLVETGILYASTHLIRLLEAAKWMLAYFKRSAPATNIK